LYWKMSCIVFYTRKSFPKETAVNRIGAVVRIALSAAIVMAGFCYVGQTAIAQNSTPAAQDQMQQPDNQKPAAETQTFAGKIVKTGKTLVLSDAEGNTTYRLDDQQKAKKFVNKDVKVTGVLDASTGMIRVTAIEPA
jgi:Protein of unknown function (DUF5818)